MVYEPFGRLRYLALVVLAVFAVVAVCVVVAAFLGHGPPLPFLALWLAALAWNAYWWLWRTCTKLEVLAPARELRWSTLLRSGSVPLGDVSRVRPAFTGRQLAAVEIRDRRALLVPVRYGYERLVQALAAAGPHIVFQP